MRGNPTLTDRMLEAKETVKPREHFLEKWEHLWRVPLHTHHRKMLGLGAMNGASAQLAARRHVV